jgi:hypothetical protein
MARHPSILLPACAYAMVFLFGGNLDGCENVAKEEDHCICACWEEDRGVSSHCQWDPKINGGQFILYLFFGPETLYLGSGIESRESARKISTVARMLPKRKTIAYAHAGRRIEGCRAIVSGRTNS